MIGVSLGYGHTPGVEDPLGGTWGECTSTVKTGEGFRTINALLSWQGEEARKLARKAHLYVLDASKKIVTPTPAKNWDGHLQAKLQPRLADLLKVPVTP